MSLSGIRLSNWKVGVLSCKATEEWGVRSDYLLRKLKSILANCGGNAGGQIVLSLRSFRLTVARIETALDTLEC